MAYFFPYTKGFLLYELNRFEKNRIELFWNEIEPNRMNPESSQPYFILTYNYGS